MVADNGWKYEEVVCPSCSNSIRYYDVKGSAWFGCSYCHTFFSKDDNASAHIIRKFHSRDRFFPALALGKEGNLKGKRFVVSAYLEKHEPEEDIYWKEYLLFNPDEDSYYVLALTSGEWNFVWKSDRQDFQVMNTNVMSSEYVALQQDPHKKYDHYVSYTYDIIYAVGEFDTNILDDIHKLKVEEYIDPPDMLVSEEKNGELIWYKGMYVPNGEVKKAFADGFNDKEEETDVDKWPIIRNCAGIMLVVLMVAQLMIGFMKPERQLFNTSFQLSRDTTLAKITPIDAGTITVNGPSSLTFYLKADAYNEWLEIPVTIVNEKTGRSFEFTKVIEYYSGYEGGESWSEGSNDVEAVLSNIPSGTYKVNIFPSTDSMKNFNLDVIIVQDEMLYSNMFLMLVLILAYPTLKYFIRYQQQNNDFYFHK